MDDRGVCLEKCKESRRTSVRVVCGLWGSELGAVENKSSALLIEWFCVAYLSYQQLLKCGISPTEMSWVCLLLLICWAAGFEASWTRKMYCAKHFMTKTLDVLVLVFREVRTVLLWRLADCARND
jgi:hypothetical protein